MTYRKWLIYVSLSTFTGVVLGILIISVMGRNAHATFLDVRKAVERLP